MLEALFVCMVIKNLKEIRENTSSMNKIKQTYFDDC